jgi:hypothetical protein
VSPAEAVFWHSAISMVTLAGGFVLGWIAGRRRSSVSQPRG